MRDEGLPKTIVPLFVLRCNLLTGLKVCIPRRKMPFYKTAFRPSTSKLESFGAY